MLNLQNLPNRKPLGKYPSQGLVLANAYPQSCNDQSWQPSQNVGHCLESSVSLFLACILMNESVGRIERKWKVVFVYTQ